MGAAKPHLIPARLKALFFRSLVSCSVHIGYLSVRKCKSPFNIYFNMETVLIFPDILVCGVKAIGRAACNCDFRCQARTLARQNPKCARASLGRLHARRCLRPVASHAGVPVGLESGLLSGTFDFVEILCSAWDGTLFFKVVYHFFFVPGIDWSTFFPTCMMPDDMIGPILRSYDTS